MNKILLSALQSSHLDEVLQSPLTDDTVLELDSLDLAFLGDYISAYEGESIPASVVMGWRGKTLAEISTELNSTTDSKDYDKQNTHIRLP